MIIEIKSCSKCKLEKDISNFYKNKAQKSGYHNNCKTCLSALKKIYVESNKDLIKTKNKIYRETHKEDKKIKDKIYRESNKIEIKNKRQLNSDRNKKYYQNLDKKITKEKRRQYTIKKSKTDVFFKLKKVISNSILSSFRKSKFPKNGKTIEILGCSVESLKTHLESKFEPWMSWSNRGLYNGEINYGWDIDHIIPLSIAKTEEDIIKLNHYTNLQPLCSYTNRHIKRNNIQ